MNALRLEETVLTNKVELLEKTVFILDSPEMHFYYFRMSYDFYNI